MNTERGQVVQRDTGVKCWADIYTCDVCGSKKFLVFHPDAAPHIHLQCYQCGVTYCNGCPKGEGDKKS